MSLDTYLTEGRTQLVKTDRSGHFPRSKKLHDSLDLPLQQQHKHEICRHLLF